jgi:hypothetical protein
MAKLTKDQLLGISPETKTVEIAALGGEITIRALTRRAKKALVEAVLAGDKDADEILIVESLVEPALDRADVKKLAEMDSKAFDALAQAIGEFNGYGTDIDEADRKEMLTKVAEGEVSVESALATFRAAS